MSLLSDLRIRDLFVSDVTRDIPPVVYFHEQSPEKLEDEVSEYIITGGWPEDHPNRRRVPNGIHEQYVHLLNSIADELDKRGGPELPNAWISGFYGSGKSSFAKLLGLSLDGVALPDGRSLAEALLSRDTSPHAEALRRAWARLRQKIDPIAVVFDVGGVARDDEHIHAVAVRQVQARLGYSTKSAHVAFGELEIERAGRWAELEALASEAFGEPWDVLKDAPQAQARFSNLMAQLYPDIYRNPRDWHMRHGGTAVNVLSPEEAIAAIRDMLGFRQPGATLFLVVDEVSQYVLANPDRVERLRAFASALGSGLKGRAWLLALGQQKLEEDADASFLIKTKDRFPPKLRVHLAATNIRDVVHKRLLQKKPEVEAQLRAAFEQHRAALKLYAYGCEAVTSEEFVEVYPMLPGHIDLLLQITSALRVRSTRAQGDDQAIRGLLQLLGELFREQKLADVPGGALVTLDQIYEVQHTALDSDVQASMARILDQCADDATGLLIRVAKVVALLELIQETAPTDAKLVAQCLYDRVDRGNQVSAVTQALEELRRRNLLGYSEKHGYKIQSSAGEEWERDRRDIGVAREAISELVQDALKYLLAAPDRPRLQGRPFPWAGVFSDGRRADDVALVDPRDDAVLRVDFRFVAKEERGESAWVKRSAETALQDRLVWVCGDTDQLDHLCRGLYRSRAMVRKYKPRRESLNPSRRLLLQQEENRIEDLERMVRDAGAACFMAGRLFFRGRAITPSDQGAAFSGALSATASRVLPDLYPHFVATAVAPSELLQLIQPELSGPSPKFLTGELGVLELDAGRYVPACSGVVPRRVQEHIEAEGGLGGTTLLAHFGGPPYGYTANVVKACAAGLLRSGKLRIQPDGGAEITAVRDAGVKELFDKDRAFRRASFFPAGEDDIGFQSRARICKFFEKQLQHRMDREDHAIADAVSQLFPAQSRRLRDVLKRLEALPGPDRAPEALTKLQEVLEQAVARSRQTRPTVQLLKKQLDVLRDGIQLLNIYDAELTADAIEAVRRAAWVREQNLAQLEVVKLGGKVAESASRLRAHLTGERPWRDVAALDTDLDDIIDAYQAERLSRMLWQESQAEAARQRIKAREGFSTLTGDQSHHVLRPIALTLTDTAAEAVSPTLQAMKDPFTLALKRAADEANERLDELLSDKKLIVKVDLGLHNRELKAEEDVDALLAEIRERLMEQIAAGARVRLV
jgi:hypothetical protein